MIFRLIYAFNLYGYFGLADLMLYHINEVFTTLSCEKLYATLYTSTNVAVTYNGSILIVDHDDQHIKMVKFLK